MGRGTDMQLMPSKTEFERALSAIFRESWQTGAEHVDVSSRDLHGQVGGYPGPNHRMPTCCNVMYKAIREGDSVITRPEKGIGVIVVRYRLPRLLRHSI